MAEENRPRKLSDRHADTGNLAASRDDGLDQRRRDLDAALASRRVEAQKEAAAASSRDTSGFAQAMKLSSEFIAGIIVGAGLGWGIDYAAGTSPWGLIVFLFLGFGAGILNVLRAAGKVAEPGVKAGEATPDPSKRNRRG